METEKVCVNLSAAELGKIDVLVANGLYVNRTDVIRAGLARQFDDHAGLIERQLADVIQQRAGAAEAKVRWGFTGIGYGRMTADFLQETVDRGERIEVISAGILRFDDDVTPDLADRAVHRIRILGSVRGPAAVLERIADRIQKGRWTL